MRMIFDLFTIKGNIYKRLIQQLCEVSDTIYFTCSMEYIIDEGIPELSGQCEQVGIPADIRQWCNGDERIIRELLIKKIDNKLLDIKNNKNK